MPYSATFGPITTRTALIGNIDAFVFSNIPYAQVQPDAVQWGSVEYDGPLAPGIGGTRPLLQWHFGGIPYPISKAMRVYYTYQRTWDGSGEIETTAIYFGIQDHVGQFAGTGPFPYPPNTEKFKTRLAAGRSIAPPGSLASPSAVLASDASGLVTGAAHETNGTPSFKGLLKGAIANGEKFFCKVEAPDETFAIDFDGPAQDYDSHTIFEETLASLQRDPDAYSRVLFWYFGGKPYRITKAVRIPLDADPKSEVAQDGGAALFIGFGGLGTGSGG